jgi:hypothetical protein
MCVYPEFNHEHQEILRAIFCYSNPPEIPWTDVLSLMNTFTVCPRAMTLVTNERICFSAMQGSTHRVVILPRSVDEFYISQYMVESIRNFLISIGIEPFSN